MKKNLVALLIGAMLAFASLIALDFAFSAVSGVTVSRRSRFFPRKGVPDELGWVQTARVVRQRELIGTVTIYDVPYHADFFHRRVTPHGPAASAHGFVLFFGDSNTFGQGLTDDETIPAVVQSELRAQRVYNYAERGYGPQQMLRKLEAGRLPVEVSERQGVAVYQYFDFHVDRAIGRLSAIRWAGGQAPYYRLRPDGELEYRGSFASGRFVTTAAYWLLGQSAAATYFGVDLPRRITTEHRELVCRMLERSRSLLAEQFPGSRFIVVVGLISAKDDPFVETCLVARHITYLDLRSEYRGQAEFTFADHHLTASAARLTAQRLVPLLERAVQGAWQ